MTSPVGLHIRFGTPGDSPSLAEYEKAFFPAVPGQHHAGYMYEDEQLATLSLMEEIVAPRRSYTLVAEDRSSVVGFVHAVPSSFPGTGQLDPSSMLLMYLAVNGDRRGEGIGRELVAEVERRSVQARQNLIVAHIPEAEAGFYRSIGWEVYRAGRGFAWLPFNDHMRADDADPEIGFPLMAAKVLRPKALRITFDYPIVHGRPILDASAELLRLIATNRIDFLDLDPATREMVQFARAAEGKRLEDLTPEMFMNTGLGT